MDNRELRFNSMFFNDFPKIFHFHNILNCEVVQELVWSFVYIGSNSEKRYLFYLCWRENTLELEKILTYFNYYFSLSFNVSNPRTPKDLNSSHFMYVKYVTFHVVSLNSILGELLALYNNRLFCFRRWYICFSKNFGPCRNLLGLC